MASGSRNLIHNYYGRSYHVYLPFTQLLSLSFCIPLFLEFFSSYSALPTPLSTPRCLLKPWCYCLALSTRFCVKVSVHLIQPVLRKLCSGDAIITSFPTPASDDLKFALSAVYFPGASNSKESSCNVGDPGLIPGSGRSPGKGNGNPLQYSCLENSVDG